MGIRGVTRSQFEQTLPRLLTPTTPIRSIEFLRGRDKILEKGTSSFTVTVGSAKHPSPKPQLLSISRPTISLFSWVATTHLRSMVPPTVWQSV